jgi:hypothetical protein
LASESFFLKREDALQEYTLQELQGFYKSENGGIVWCLYELASWLVADGIDRVLELLSEDYDSADHKRTQDCLHFLMEGIVGLNRQDLEACIGSTKELTPELEKSAQAYKESSSVLESAQAEWHEAAKKVEHEVRSWKRWMFELEQQRRRGTTARSSILVCASRTYNRFMFVSAIFESPQRFRSNQKYFQEVIQEIDTAIELAHLANRLPLDLDVRRFHHSIKELEKRQGQFDALTSNNENADSSDKKFWESYQQRLSDVVRILSQMRDAHLWSLFWLYHPTMRDYAAI